MKSFQELRDRLQGEKVAPKGWKRPWGYITFQRGPSIYITWLLAHTPIQPDHVTKFGLFLGLLGCFFVFQFETYYKLIGIFLLYMYLVLDRVDGELARFKKIYSLRGIYWDHIGHLILPPLFWFGLVFGLTKISVYELRYVLGFGTIGALALMATRVIHSLPAQIYAKRFLKHRDLFVLPKKENVVIHDVVEPENQRGLIRSLLRPLANLQDFFVILIIVTLALLLEQIFAPDEIFHIYLNRVVVVGNLLFIAFALEVAFRKAHSIETEIESIERSG